MESHIQSVIDNPVQRNILQELSATSHLIFCHINASRHFQRSFEAGLHVNCLSLFSCKNKQLNITVLHSGITILTIDRSHAWFLFCKLAFHRFAIVIYVFANACVRALWTLRLVSTSPTFQSLGKFWNSSPMIIWTTYRPKKIRVPWIPRFYHHVWHS